MSGKNLRKKSCRLPHPVVGRIITAVDALAENPFPSGVVKLTGAEHSFRTRVGDYRVIYTVEKAVLTIQIIRVRHRRDVYR